MDIQLITQPEIFLELRSSWNELAEKNDFQSVFLRQEFIYAWWQTFKKDLYILAGYAEKKLVALAPFYLENSKLYFLGRPQTDYSDIICLPEYKTEFWQKILLHAKVHKIKNIILEQIPDRSSSLEILRRLGFQINELIKCPSLVIKGQEELVQNELLKKKSLKRHFNYFAKNGELAFKNILETEAMLCELPDFFKQHIERWENTSSPSLFLDPKNKTFYELLIKSFAGTGKLIFSVIYWNQQKIAFHLGFSHSGVFTWYKPTYEPKLSDKSPGEVLIKFLLEEALKNNQEEFDFTRGLEQFKLRFANQVRTNYLCIWKKDLKYFLEKIILEIKKYPGLVAFLRNFRKKT